MPMILVSPEASLFGLQMPPSCSQSIFRGGGGETGRMRGRRRKRKGEFPFSSCKSANPVGLGSTLPPHLTLITSLKVSSLNTVTSGVRTLAYRS